MDRGRAHERERWTVPSSVSRELKRNVSQRGYRAGMADEKAKARQRARRNAKAFTPQQWVHVEHYLRLNLSPEQIMGRLELEGEFKISHESIYRFAYRDKGQGGDLVSFLHRGHFDPYTPTQRPMSDHHFRQRQGVRRTRPHCQNP